MQSFYVIIENGEAYATAYKSYAAAVSAVKDKHCEYLYDQIKQMDSLQDIESILADVNPPENTETNKTYLYIEKGIHIMIYKISLA